ncbi:Protein CROWDED NUCLEI 1 [Linum perenne]
MSSSTTPQRKTWSVWSLTPRRDLQKSGDLLQTPNSNGTTFSNSGDGRVIRALDSEDLAAKISRLENQLFEYSMELLLVEKQEWNAKSDQLKQALADVKNALKQEQASQLIVNSDAEKREENLRKALGVEKQCVLDLEKTVQEMRYENAEIKFMADSKLAEANALMSSVEEKSLEVEAKLRSVDARLAEVSRKSSELERKSKDVETRESALRRDRLSLIAEKEAHENTLSNQREDLREWEKKLQEEEERLSKGLMIVNQREERANENDRVSKLKERDLEEAQKKIDEANSVLKKKEDEINSRFANLNLRENEFDATKSKLELQEAELRLLEEKLNERERVEIQRLIDEHTATLDAKKLEFEIETEERRNSLDEELKSKVLEVERKEAEVEHHEAKVRKRELALDKRLDKIKEKEKEVESKSKALKEREKAIKSEEKNLMVVKTQLQSDEEELLNLKAELENLKATNEQQLLEIREEKVKLQISEDEKSEYARLQAELKEETEKCRFREELLLKEAEDLKQQKENFEREWLELDVKKAEIERALKKVKEQMENFEKQKLIEEERINHDRQSMDYYIKREFESLELAKESFKSKMEHELSMSTEKAQSDRNIMLHDIELQKSEIENSLQLKQEETIKHLQEKERLFEEEKERELKNLNYLRGVARREMEELKIERLRMEKDRQELFENKKHLQEQQVEIRDDIGKLGDLSRKLKDHREVFSKEKERFIAFVEQNKDCKNCGEITSQFVLSDLITSREIENVDILPVSRPSGSENLKLVASGRLEAEKSPTVSHAVTPVSWLRKCTTKIFQFSPLKRIDLVGDLTEGAPDINGTETSNRLDVFEDEQELSLSYANDSLGGDQRVYTGTEEPSATQDLSTENQSNINSKSLELQEISESSDLNGGQGRNKRRVKVNKTRSVKAVVEELNMAEDSGRLQCGSHEESTLADKGTPKKGKKRSRTQTSQTRTVEHDGNVSDEHSGSTVAGKRRKRRQKVSSVQVPGEARYNLRRPKLREAVVDAKTSCELNHKKRNEDVGAMGRKDEDILRSAANITAVAGGAGENEISQHIVQVEEVAEAEHNDGTATIPDEKMENGSLEMGESRRESDGEEDEDEDEEEDDADSEHPGEVSVGKKLWTFLTT